MEQWDFFKFYPSQNVTVQVQELEISIDIITKFKIINVINVPLTERICNRLQGSSETEDLNKMTNSCNKTLSRQYLHCSWQ